jgi:hypothetical protein
MGISSAAMTRYLSLGVEAKLGAHDEERPNP